MRDLSRWEQLDAEKDYTHEKAGETRSGKSVAGQDITVTRLGRWLYYCADIHGTGIYLITSGDGHTIVSLQKNLELINAHKASRGDPYDTWTSFYSHYEWKDIPFEVIYSWWNEELKEGQPPYEVPTEETICSYFHGFILAI